MQYWLPPLLRGQTMFIVASGPSAVPVVGSTIAINCSFRIVPDASFLFFHDVKWLTAERENDLAGFRGEIVTTARIHSRLPIRRIQTEVRNEFPPVGCGVVRHGRSSGHIAVALAVAMGAARIVLVGFDMREVQGRSHFHNEYPHRAGRGTVYQNEFIPGFAGWNATAKKRGATIVNATPGSALKEFPMVTLTEVF